MFDELRLKKCTENLYTSICNYFMKNKSISLNADPTIKSILPDSKDIFLH